MAIEYLITIDPESLSRIKKYTNEILSVTGGISDPVETLSQKEIVKIISSVMAIQGGLGI